MLTEKEKNIITMNKEAMKKAAKGCPFDLAFCALYNGRPLTPTESIAWFNATELLRHTPHD